MAKAKKMADGGDPTMDDSSEYSYDDMKEPPVEMTTMYDSKPLNYDTTMYRSVPAVTSAVKPSDKDKMAKMKPPRPNMPKQKSMVNKPRSGFSNVADKLKSGFSDFSNKPTSTSVAPTAAKVAAPNSFQSMAETMPDVAQKAMSVIPKNFGFKKGGSSTSTTKMSTHEKSKKSPCW